MSKDYIKNEFNFWRYLINFWSLIFFVTIVFDFFANNAYGDLLNILTAIYISALAIYVSNKEFERWYDKHEGRHPGEIFVVAWSALVFFLFLLDFAYQTTYQMPNSIISSYIAVLTMLAVTRKSKQMYNIKHAVKKRK